MDDERIDDIWDWNGSGVDWKVRRTTRIPMARVVTRTEMVIGHQLVHSKEIEDDNNSDARNWISTVEHQIDRVVIRRKKSMGRSMDDREQFGKRIGR
ncbi:hypothetical protein L5515_008658 [Caenorhabditis briggsae]|uniref:Uncharacterized protein n=1 Tax=Caenorhabditis briggsae TaxID=6238 RepID=A0AAE9JMP9_CAEBR|nr:hypothetical protein L5515_008658 [Caenorhabditis briggsae]